MPKGGKKGDVPQCVTTNPLHGTTENKVITLGLSSRADEMRSAGYSLSDICKELNEKYLSESEYKLSIMSLQRYFAKYSSVGKVDNRIKSEEALNVASELRMLYDTTIDTLEVLQLSLAESRKNKDFKTVRDNAHLVEKLTARSVGILQTTSDMMSRVYTYANLNRVIEIMFKIIEDECGLETCAKIKNTMKNYPELFELTRKIKDVKQ